MYKPRPIFIGFIVVVVTIVLAMLYISLPEEVEAVDTGSRLRGYGNFGEFHGRQVEQRPLLVGVWLMIVVPLGVWGIVVVRRESRAS